MWGIGIGSALGLHSFSRHRSHFKASDTAIKTMIGISALTWFWCRYKAREEKKLFDAVFEAQSKAKQKKLESANNPTDSSITTINNNNNEIVR